MGKHDTGSTVVATKETLSTKDYGIFRTMEGNRNVDEKHVKELQRLMLLNGNLTYEFPIVVNKDMFVVDGQHRLKALEGLGWEVCYIIQEDANITTVRAINKGNRNWSWKDIGQSYANLGLDDYRWFLWFARTYELTFGFALRLATSTPDRSMFQVYNEGGLSVTDKTLATEMAQQWKDVSEATGITSSRMQLAFFDIQRAPAYDHERMVKKLHQRGELIPRQATQTEYKRHLEDAFNHGYVEENKARLF